MSRQYTLQRVSTSTSTHLDYAAEPNEQQLAAVTAPPGPILLIAGAASGKTGTLRRPVPILEIFCCSRSTQRFDSGTRQMESPYRGHRLLTVWRDRLFGLLERVLS
jgi:hypothetical protein